MAGGIAHEINTPLTVIQGYAEYTNTLDLVDKKNHEVVKENLNKIEKTTSKIYHIIRGLQLFARDGEKDPKELVKLKDFLNENCEIVDSKLIQKNIKLKIDCPENLVIPMRQVQMSQVIVNLINNSRDAISDLANRWINIQVLDLKDTVMIEVTDSGLGISESVAVKIFNPFFTTKPVGQGTGLGLSISKGIIEDHGGVFSLKPNCVNTCFQIKLPKDGENYGNRTA